MLASVDVFHRIIDAMKFSSTSKNIPEAYLIQNLIILQASLIYYALCNSSWIKYRSILEDLVVICDSKKYTPCYACAGLDLRSKLPSPGQAERHTRHKQNVNIKI